MIQGVSLGIQYHELVIEVNDLVHSGPCSGTGLLGLPETLAEQGDMGLTQTVLRLCGLEFLRGDLELEVGLERREEVV